MAKKGLTREDDFLNPEASSGVGKAIRKSKLFKDAMKKVREGIKKAIKKIFETIVELIGKTMPYSLIVIAVIIVILLFVSLIQAFLNLPGDMQARLKSFFDKKFEGWHFNNGAVVKLKNDYSDIIDVVNYLEEMEYDVINYGFVKPKLDTKKVYTMDELLTSGYAFNTYQYMQEQGFSYGNTDNDYHLFNIKTGELYDGTYYNGVGIEINNSNNERVLSSQSVNGQQVNAYIDNFGMIRSTEEYNENGKGKLVLIKEDQAKSMYGMIRTYLLSDYRIYSLRNYDQKVLNLFTDGFKIVFGGNQDAWCKGLVKLYNAQNGIASSMWNFSDRLLGDSAHITRDTLELKDGYFNNAMQYKIEGWAPRYGLSLEFLLSLHLGTMAPDLVYAILQNFDTEVQVYLNDSGEAAVNARYIDPEDPVSIPDGLSIEKIKDALSRGGLHLESFLVNDAALTQGINKYVLSKKACMILLRDSELHIESQYNCTGAVTDYHIETGSYDEDAYMSNAQGSEDSGKNLLKNKYYYTDNDLESIDLQYYEQGGDPKYYNASTMLQSVKYPSSWTNNFYTDVNRNSENPNEAELQRGEEQANSDRETARNKLQSSHVDLSTIQTINESHDSQDPDPDIKYRIEKDCEKLNAPVYGWFDESTKTFNYGTYEDFAVQKDGHEWEETDIEYFSYIYKVYRTMEEPEEIQDPTPENPEDPDAPGGNYTRYAGYVKYCYTEDMDINDQLDDDLSKAIKNYVRGIYTIKIFADDSNNFKYVVYKSDDLNSIGNKLGEDKYILRQETGSSQSSLVYRYGVTFFPIPANETIEGYLLSGLIYNEYGTSLYLKKSDLSLDSLSYSSHVNHENSFFSDDNIYVSGRDGQTNPGQNVIVYGEEQLIDVLYLSVVVRNRSTRELQYYNVIDENGNRTNGGRCSHSDLETKTCCSACQDYVIKVVDAIANVSDQSYKMYTPYIARVVGSWFRNTYFVIPTEIGDGQGEDQAIYDYAKKDYHTEFREEEAYGNTVNFVDVDLDYLADSGEYWSAYEMKTDPTTGEDTNEYQLFVLKPNGITSNTKMEDFLSNGQIDGEQATIDGNPVTGYESQKEAENAGWAFVKKSKMTDITTFAADSYVMNEEENGVDTSKLLWSAYVFDSSGTTSDWKRVLYDDDNDYIKAVYEIIYYEEEEEGDDEGGDEGGDGGDEEGDEESGFDEERANDPDEKTGFFYEIEQANSVKQEEDAQRGPTNPLIKYLFKYRQYYIYDGTEKTALAIEHDKYRVLNGYGKYISANIDQKNEFYTNKEFVEETHKNLDSTVYGSSTTDGNFYHYIGIKKLLENKYGWNWDDNVIDLLNRFGRSALRETYGSGTLAITVEKDDLASQWLDWQLDMYYMKKYGVDLYQYYDTTTNEVKNISGESELLVLDFDPRDPDLVSTVSIEKSSLNSFAILENTGTIDAEYQYRDFKELIVELNYFDKEDLSEKNPEIFTWVLPEAPVAINWPILPVDKQDVEYGTLIHSHQTYVDLGIDFSSASTGGGAGLGNVDKDKLYWIGDSWTCGLVEKGILPGTEVPVNGGGNGSYVKNDRIIAVVGASASGPNAGVGGGVSIADYDAPSDTSAIVIALGKNDVSASSTKTFIDGVSSKYPDKQIVVLKLSYFGTDPYEGIGHGQVDTFNSELQTYCSGKDKVTFIDPTGSINDTSGHVIKSEYNAGDNVHLKGDGYQTWYNDIIAGISGNAGSNPSGGSSQQSSNPSNPGGGQSQRPSASGDFGVTALDEEGSSNPEHAGYIIKTNGIEYLQFNQSGHYGSLQVYNGPESHHIRTDGDCQTLSGMGCGIYSTTSLMSAYIEDVSPEKTVKWLHDNIGTSSFNNNGNRQTSINKILNDNGITGQWYSSNYEQVLKEAFSAGKPIIANIAPGTQHWTTKGGHFICFTGISQDGTVYSADSVTGGGSRLEYKAASDFDSAVSKFAQMMNFNYGVWVPNEAPTGVRRSGGSSGNGNGGEQAQFQGYQNDQYVVSPVTGRVLEYGTHKRINVYTLEEEVVGYVKIEVMSSEYFTDSMMSSEIMDAYESMIEDDDLKDKYGTPAKSLNLFYKEYENVCAGFQIMIDGFKVDLSLDEDSNKSGEYVQNKVRSLYNTNEQKKRDAMEQAKDDAPFMVNYGVNENSHPLKVEDDDYLMDTLGDETEKVYYRYNEDTDGLKGYYVKEGKYLGKTITSDEEADPNNPDEETPNPENPDPETPTPETPNPENPNPENPDEENPEEERPLNADGEEIPEHTDYMRIIIQNLDYSQVENVERFFYRPNIVSQGGGVVGSVSQEYQAQPRDLECLAQAIRYESGGWEAYLTKYNVHGDEEAEFNGYCMGYSVVNKLLEENKANYGMYYDSSRTDMSPLVQVLTNQKYTWYGNPIPEKVMNVFNGAEGDYSAKDLSFAEFCLKYDCTSVVKPFETVLSSQALGHGYSATPAGKPIPRAMCQQGGFGDGASGQDDIILVGFEDMNKDGQFNVPDEIFGVDRTMQSQIPYEVSP